MATSPPKRQGRGRLYTEDQGRNNVRPLKSLSQPVGAKVTFPFFLTKLLIRSRLARLLPAFKLLSRRGGVPVHQLSDRILALAHDDLTEAAEFLDTDGSDIIDLSSGSPQFDVTPSGSTKLPA